MFCSGLATAAIALSILTGWLTGTEGLVRVGSSAWLFSPAGSVSYLLVGLACVAASRGRRGLSLGLSAGGVLVLIPAMAWHVAGTDFGVGRWLVRSLPGAMRPAHPNGDSILTMLVALSGTGGLAGPRRLRIRSGIAGTQGLALLGIGLSAFAAYVLRLPQLDGQPYHAPLQGLAMIVCTGGALAYWAWQEQEHGKGRAARFGPLFAALAVLGGTGMLWYILQRQERLQVHHMNDLAADAVRGTIATKMRESNRVLRSMGDSWGDLQAKGHELEASSFLRNHPAYRSVGWMDPSLCLKWVVPPGAAMGCADPAILRALAGGRMVTVETHEGSRSALAVYAPALRRGALKGYVTAQLDLPGGMDTLTAEFAGKFGLALSNGGHEFYRRQSDVAGPGVTRPVEAPGAQWEARVWLRPEWINQGRAPLPEFVMGAGITLAGLLSLALRLAVTARQRAVEIAQSARTLQQSELRYALAARATNDAIWDWDVIAGRITWNEGLHTLFGYADGPVTSLAWWRERIHPQDLENVLAATCKAIDSGVDNWEKEYRFLKAGGAYATVIDRGYLVRDGAGKPTRMIGAMTDVTPRRELEEQLRQSQKMEAVGQLAGGVAHDFNNLLTVIIGYGAVVRERLAPHDPSLTCILEIESAANRAAALTAQLLAFGRRQMLRTQVLDLNRVIHEMNTMLRRLVGEHIEMVTVPGRDLAPVRADPAQIGQVVMNLVINARDAMPRGGTVRIETANAREGVIVTVRDNGSGMDEATQARLFEPFFTTKGVGKGTGLGLSTVYGIVKQSGGEISVQSEVGKGSVFEVWLPGL